jgi:predicted double-glycine peptidase
MSETYMTVIDGQLVQVQVIPPTMDTRRGASPEFPFIHGDRVTHSRSENPIADLELADSRW